MDIKSLAWAVVCVLGVGCASGELEKAHEDADSGELGGSIDVDEEPSDSDAPVLLEASVYQAGSKCFLEATYSDPQGPADVRRGTVLAVDPASDTIHWTDDLFVCVDHGCIGSFDDAHTQYASAPCNQLGRYELVAYVYDRSGLESNVLELQRD